MSSFSYNEGLAEEQKADEGNDDNSQQEEVRPFIEELQK